MFLQRFGLWLLLLTIIFTTTGCGGPSAVEIEGNKPVKIKIWRTFDGPDTFEDIMMAYQKIHPNVSFDYKRLRIEEYENELIQALARGTGPDIFSLHNTWIFGYTDLIAPLPSTVSIPFTQIKGTIKKEKVTELQKRKTTSIQELKKNYVDVVSEDVVKNEKIYGLPLALDTLALYYNSELLNAAGIANPPQTWSAFQEAVKKITRLDIVGNILQSGAAIGTGKNIERASDLLSVLMLQSGTEITGSQGQAIFGTEQNGRTPGMDTMRFYTDFANPLKEVYTWNQEQPNSFDAFVSGKTAFFFGYAYHLPLLKTQAPKLDIRVTALPQIEGSRVVNFANYWVETVSKASPNQKWAWDFIEFATSKDRAKTYLEKSGKPTARRDLISSQIEEEYLSVFVNQILTAKSWYHGKNAPVAEQALIDLIDEILSGSPYQEAFSRAQNKINQTL